jgi:molecular chaperone Hsp33
MGCDAVLGGDGSIVAAGGVLVQCMPDGGQTNMVAEMWRRLRFDAVFDTLKSRPGITAEDLARAVLGEFADELDVLDIRPVQFHCDCTLERVCESLTLIASDELQAMIDEDEGAEITCDFCRETYVFNAAQLIAIRDAAGPRATS